MKNLFILAAVATALTQSLMAQNCPPNFSNGRSQQQYGNVVPGQVYYDNGFAQDQNIQNFPQQQGFASQGQVFYGDQMQHQPVRQGQTYYYYRNDQQFRDNGSPDQRFSDVDTNQMRRSRQFRDNFSSNQNYYATPEEARNAAVRNNLGNPQFGSQDINNPNFRNAQIRDSQNFSANQTYYSTPEEARSAAVRNNLGNPQFGNQDINTVPQQNVRTAPITPNTTTTTNQPNFTR